MLKFLFELIEKLFKGVFYIINFVFKCLIKIINKINEVFKLYKKRNKEIKNFENKLKQRTINLNKELY